MIDRRKEASEALASNEGSEGSTYKLDIHDKEGVHSLYVTVVLLKEKDEEKDEEKYRISYINIALDGSFSPEVKALMEPLCREGYALVRSGIWDSWQLISSWRAYKFKPQGVCPQLESIVTSPLDAVSRLLEVKLKEKGILNARENK